jgi:predicted glycoside hydrolase/deacetylase ChbG (UPF0249 family)
MPPSRLIVNADDFGISNTVNRAILESIESGLVTSTSIMANMPGFEDAVMLVREHTLLTGRIGVHLNLTEGHPLSRPILDCPYFCNDNGCFAYDRKRSLFILSRQEKRAVYEEMRTQLEKVLAAGIKPTHLDSHHHVHTEWAIAPLICRLGREYDIHRIRLTRNIGQPPGPAKRFYKLLFNKWRLGSRRDFHNTDYFGDIGDMKIFFSQNSLDGKTTEIMVHPLFNEEGELVDLDRQSLYRQLWSILEKQPTLRLSPTDPLQ